MSQKGTVGGLRTSILLPKIREAWMKCPYCMEEIQDGAMLCKHCKSSVIAVSPVQQSFNNRLPCYEAPAEKKTPWFQVTILTTGVVLAKFAMSANPRDDDAVGAAIFFSIVQVAFGIAAVNAQSSGRKMAVAGLVLGILSFMIACNMSS